jgi:hypothetical protein
LQSEQERRLLTTNNSRRVPIEVNRFRCRLHRPWIDEQITIFKFSPILSSEEDNFSILEHKSDDIPIMVLNQGPFLSAEEAGSAVDRSSPPPLPSQQQPVNGATDEETQPLLHQSQVPSETSWTPPPRFSLIELALMSNVFLYGFDGTITAATYGVISSEFNATNSASWLTTSYLVTSTAFQPLYGRVSDIFGRRICFFISTITFALGCIGCGAAQDIVSLNLMRALTGFGGGGLMTMGTSLEHEV